MAQDPTLDTYPKRFVDCNVGWLEVAVHNSLLVQRPKRQKHLVNNKQRLRVRIRNLGRIVHEHVLQSKAPIGLHHKITVCSLESEIACVIGVCIFRASASIASGSRIFVASAITGWAAHSTRGDDGNNVPREPRRWDRCYRGPYQVC